MNVILCGYNWVGCKALSILRERGYNVYVYTHPNPWYVNSLIDICKKYQVSFTTEKISYSNLPFKPDLIVSIYYRYIIPKEVIQAVNGRIFNLHPSLLPLYRGCSSLTWAIINGEKKVGFTYHYIDEDIDTGNILFQKEISLEDWDTQMTLYTRTMYKSMEYFDQVLDLALNGDEGTPQKGEGSYYKRGCPLDGKINLEWDKDRTDRFIRAMIYPPLPCATFGDREIRTMDEFLENKNHK